MQPDPEIHRFQIALLVLDPDINGVSEKDCAGEIHRIHQLFIGLGLLDDIVLADRDRPPHEIRHRRPLQYRDAFISLRLGIV
jgi:hypothetical protein